MPPNDTRVQRRGAVGRGRCNERLGGRPRPCEPTKAGNREGKGCEVAAAHPDHGGGQSVDVRISYLEVLARSHKTQDGEPDKPGTAEGRELQPGAMVVDPQVLVEHEKQCIAHEAAQDGEPNENTQDCRYWRLHK